MKTSKKIYGIAFLMLAMLCIAPMVSAKTLTPVQRHGNLKVEGRFLVDQNGQKVALHGVSFGWHNWWHRFFNEGSVYTVSKGWGADIVRCSIGLDLDDNCFNKNPELGYKTVDRMVKAAKKNGIYIIVDFHSHNNNLELAKQFFTTVAKKYGKLPNVLYEIWNEPLEVQWSETKEYSEELIPIIRKYAPNSVIIVPTPRWDQDVDKAADNPITKFDNLVYSLHYYAAFHKDDLRNKARYAISKGLPLFISESGGMMHTGDGQLDEQSWKEWLDLARENSISWIAWSISDKVETCSMLTPGSPSDGREWKMSNMKPWTMMVRKYLKLEKDYKGE